MDTPIEQRKKDYRLLLGSFRRTKNTPVDYYFLISSLQNLDIEIPVKLRHSGEMFFSIKENKLYRFSNPLEGKTDITEYECLDDETVYSLTVEKEDYTNVMRTLDDMFVGSQNKIGLRCYIKPLNIMVVNNGTSWVYGGGDYKISTVGVWDTIPVALKSVQKLVLVGAGNNTDFYNVGRDYLLEQRVIVTDELPSENLREGVYYVVGNYLYRVTNSYPYKIGVKSSKESYDPVTTTESYSVVTSIGVSTEYSNHLSTTKNNIINHLLDTTNISVTIIPSDARVNCCSPEFEIIDRNNISIKSMSKHNNCKIIINKIYEDE